MSVELILGGARSGKSRYALQQALVHDQAMHRVAWLATAQAYDAEMHARIVHHQAERPAHWQTIEAPLALADALQHCTAPYVVVDCLTLWLSNWLCREDAGLEAIDWQRERQHFFAQLQIWQTDVQRQLLLVSNEVGFGIVPDNPLARRFRDEAGRLHQQIAQQADRVTLVVAGIPLPIKSPAFLSE